MFRRIDLVALTVNAALARLNSDDALAQARDADRDVDACLSHIEDWLNLLNSAAYGEHDEVSDAPAEGFEEWRKKNIDVL